MATTDGTNIVTPVGRIVWGHPAIPKQRVDQNTKRPIMNDDGTPSMEFVFGFAIPKDQFGPVWGAMSAEAAKGYPNGAPANFAWKYDDGDDTRTPNGGGVPYAQREGYPGHYVLTISSRLTNPPPIYRYNAQTGGYDQLAANDIKTGDFVAISLGFKCNVPENRSHTPSLYVNPEGLEFVGYGKEIQSANAINPMQAFGGRQHQLPPGASATPMSSAPAGVGMPQPQQPMQGVGGMPGQMPPMGQPAPMQQQPQYQQPAPAMQGYPQQTMPGAPAPQPQQYGQPAQGGYPPPATDFIPGQPQQQPMQGVGGMPGQPAPMQQGYPQQSAPQYQQPMQGGMPGQMPPR